MFPLFFCKISNVMFFYIGTNCPIRSINRVSQNLFLDKGWEHLFLDNISYWFKGYSTDCILKDNIENIVNGYQPKGKWSVVTSTGKIYHPVLRGFPVYINELGDKTNIPLPNFLNEIYPVQKIVRSQTKITLLEASEHINDILTENIQNFLKYNNIDKLNVLFSAGIDTLTVWSIVDKLGIDYNLHIHEPKVKNIFGTITEYDSDLIELLRKKFWGYKMTSCFTKSNCYITGFYSERVQLREVSQGHAICNFTKTELHKIPKKTDYLYYFLQRPNNKINNEPTFENLDDLLDYCNASVFFDYQMWHIDNNLHFSPFFDYRITEVINKLSLDDIIQNASDATIQKNIIKLNRPNFMSILSDYKNEGSIFKNYKKNFKNIELKHNINIKVT